MKKKADELDETLIGAGRISGRGRIPDPAQIDYVWQTRAQQILTLLDENGLGADWEWDQESATFYTTWSFGAVLIPDGYRPASGLYIEPGFIKLNVTLDPRKGIRAEIERLLELELRVRRDGNRLLQHLLGEIVRIGNEDRAANGGSK